MPDGAENQADIPRPDPDCLCRDCLHVWTAPAAPQNEGEASESDRRGTVLLCPACRSRRTMRHPELHRLSIAHIDCDAFYASVEKRDNPEIRDKPVIVGGGRRGVVSAACYVARMYGVRSAMPMFKALQACPDAVVIRPNMEKYAGVGREIRQMMRDATPLVQPLSIDEAFLDLTGTESLHGGSPARTLAGLVLRIERDAGVTASIGLSYNKFLAKVSSDLDKPRGFAVIGEAEAVDFLTEKPVKMIWGVGKALERKLHQDGLSTIGQLREMPLKNMIQRYGSMGERLYHFSRGIDDRKVDPTSETKSISNETTFAEDLSDFHELAHILWPLCESVARRLKKHEYSAGSVQLKLRTADFKILTRSRKLSTPTQLAEILFRQGLELLEKEADGRRYRLLGIGGADLGPPEDADVPDLADPDRDKAAKLERVMDEIREKLGSDAVIKGRSL
ncbi:DNA polymerase IV [Hwanghaeella grinnelliae]|uniref:DNA polymerase IV n=1 Tax=Hwanghaeella grinnelliae TaxID=2500179 RepID=A0A437QV41_9PROT|nr:DNA polymerase IV [Hwanghaeella grinnelliae]RVU38368.1 DNA polymerase IV [Hwanghaeella grinnelliae]